MQQVYKKILKNELATSSFADNYQEREIKYDRSAMRNWGSL